jgi:hypothetical protein
VLDRVLEGEDTTLGLRFVTDVGVLLVHADHDTGVRGAWGGPRDGGEDSTGSVVAGEASLAHAGAVADYECLYVFIISHGKRLWKD